MRYALRLDTVWSPAALGHGDIGAGAEGDKHGETHDEHDRQTWVASTETASQGNFVCPCLTATHELKDPCTRAVLLQRLSCRGMSSHVDSCLTGRRFAWFSHFTGRQLHCSP
jgi:hypothetical protein